MAAALTGTDPIAAARLTLECDGWIIRQGYVSETFLLSWFGTTWTMAGTLRTLLALAIAWFVPDSMEITGYREGFFRYECWQFIDVDGAMRDRMTG